MAGKHIMMRRRFGLIIPVILLSLAFATSRVSGEQKIWHLVTFSAEAPGHGSKDLPGGLTMTPLIEHPLAENFTTPKQIRFARWGGGVQGVLFSDGESCHDKGPKYVVKLTSLTFTIGKVERSSEDKDSSGKREFPIVAEVGKTSARYSLKGVDAFVTLSKHEVICELKQGAWLVPAKWKDIKKKYENAEGEKQREETASEGPTPGALRETIQSLEGSSGGTGLYVPPVPPEPSPVPSTTIPTRPPDREPEKRKSDRPADPVRPPAKKTESEHR